jgi:hypothetical protein
MRDNMVIVIRGIEDLDVQAAASGWRAARSTASSFGNAMEWGGGASLFVMAAFYARTAKVVTRGRGPTCRAASGRYGGAPYDSGTGPDRLTKTFSFGDQR